MTLIRSTDTRRSETPSGVMTTLASPSLGGAETAVWRVEMQPDIQGPVHLIDAEQIWTVLSGEAMIDLNGEKLVATAGDTAVVAGGITRQVTAGTHGFTAIVTARAGARASVPGGTGSVVPPWIA